MATTVFKHVTTIEFGIGVSSFVGARAKELGGTKALIVSDPGLIATGMVDKLEALVNEAGIPSARFSDIKSNPLVSTIEKGVKVLQENNCDIIIAIGGGSSMDVAKCIGIVDANGGHILDYEFMPITGLKNPLTGPKKKPLIAIPTTAGTGSEVTIWAVLTSPERKTKLAFGDIKFAADITLSDPNLTVSVPAHLTAAQGMDALTHAIEAYTSRYTCPESDALGLYAIKLIAANLRRATAKGDDMTARENMLRGSMMAGMAFSSAPVGCVHAIANTLGGYYDVPHGVANAIILPFVMRYNTSACPERFADIAVAMGVPLKGRSIIELSDLAVEAVERLSKDVGIPGLKEVGVKEEGIPEIALLAFNDMQHANNIKHMPLKLQEELLRKAL